MIKALSIDTDASASTLNAKIFTQFEKTFEYESDPLATRCTLSIFKVDGTVEALATSSGLFGDSVFPLLIDRVSVPIGSLTSLPIRSSNAPGFFYHPIKSIHQALTAMCLVVIPLDILAAVYVFILNP